MSPRHNDNIPGQISEAIFPGRKVRRLTINLEVGALATVEAEIYCGDELRTVLGVIGDRPAWRFADDEPTRCADGWWFPKAKGLPPPAPPVPPRPPQP